MTDGADGVTVFVRPNRYERFRAHVIVYNWDKRPVVTFDPSSVLRNGLEYEVRDAQNYFGAPVTTGVYTKGATISLPMTNLPLAPTAGDVTVAPRHTAPEFGVFVLRARILAPR